MDTSQWPQEIIVKPLEEIVTNTNPKPQPPQRQQPLASRAVGEAERKARPETDQAINCPRCNSTNTKFCYYNNYSLTQPRFFCKSCRRYWTQGGSLRNIPVGGGSKKNKRSSYDSTSNISNNHLLPTQPHTKKHLSDNLMSMSQQQDLNLGFQPHGLIRTNFTDLINNIGNNNNNKATNTNNNPFLGTSCPATSAMTMTTSSSFTGFEVHNNNNQEGFSMQDHHYKPCNTSTTLLGFSLDHNSNGFQGGGGGDDDDVSGRQLFPFDDLKLPVSSSLASINNIVNDNQKGGNSSDGAATSAGYWSGMLSGGSWS
ncbi:unnamed protein product [Cochlearia groenlandica]